MSEEKQEQVVEQAVAVAPAKPPAEPKPVAAVVVYDPDDVVSLYMNSGVFGQLQRVGRMMALSTLVPEHLQGEAHLSDCALVCAQAFRWRLDPFAVAQHTFVHKSKLGYEGKLIAAIINSRREIEKRLSYEYSGEGAKRRVTVSAQLRGESKARTVEGTVGEWETANEKWKTMTDQMLSYRGAREWARRHLPEAVLGLQADEEVKEVVELEARRDGVFEPAKPAAANVVDAETVTAQAADPFFAALHKQDVSTKDSKADMPAVTKEQEIAASVDEALGPPTGKKAVTKAEPRRYKPGDLMDGRKRVVVTVDSDGRVTEARKATKEDLTKPPWPAHLDADGNWCCDMHKAYGCPDCGRTTQEQPTAAEEPRKNCPREHCGAPLNVLGDCEACGWPRANFH